MDAVESKFKFLSHYLEEHPDNASQVLLNSEVSEISDIVSKLPSSVVAPSLSQLPTVVLADALVNIEKSKVTELISLFSANISASILRNWIKEKSNHKQFINDFLLGLNSNELAKAIKVLLDYPEGTIGSLMNSVPLTVSASLSCEEVLSVLHGKKNRYSRYIYVIDADSLLQGSVPFKDVFYSPKNSLISELMTSKVFSLKATMSASEVFDKVEWKKWDSVPVTDSKNRLAGVIRYDVLENYLVDAKPQTEQDDGINRAGVAIGEVFQIGISATVSALGLDSRK